MNTKVSVLIRKVVLNVSVGNYVLLVSVEALRRSITSFLNYELALYLLVISGCVLLL